MPDKPDGPAVVIDAASAFEKQKNAIDSANQNLLQQARAGIAAGYDRAAIKRVVNANWRKYPDEPKAAAATLQTVEADQATLSTAEYGSNWTSEKSQTWADGRQKTLNEAISQRGISYAAASQWYEERQTAWQTASQEGARWKGKDYSAEQVQTYAAIVEDQSAQAQSKANSATEAAIVNDESVSATYTSGGSSSDTSDDSDITLISRQSLVVGAMALVGVLALWKEW